MIAPDHARAPGEAESGAPPETRRRPLEILMVEDHPGDVRLALESICSRRSALALLRSVERALVTESASADDIQRMILLLLTLDCFSIMAKAW